jgi:UDP-N-acetylglucosamine 1-carboxyvinyltransferase
MTDDIDTDLANDGMPKIKIRGGNALHGEIPISGAKNAALKLVCAGLLTDQELRLSNVPTSLRDMTTLADLLRYLGAEVDMNDTAKTMSIRAVGGVDKTLAPYDLVRKMRASILVLGPLLARHGQAKVSLPGGCAIGSRPVDLHLMGLEAMGAEIKIEDGYVIAKAPEGGLQGANILFPKVSVGATEHILMTATLANGTTTLSNAAMEPEITDLAECLVKMGAYIEGIGTNKLIIHGVEKLHGANHSVIPDRIETGTFMIAAALTGGDVTLTNTRPNTLDSVIALLKKAGAEVTIQGDKIRVKREDDLKSMRGIDIMTEPYPGFPTDMQAQAMTMLTLCDGAGMVTETIFENRFMHVPELVRMGANITVHGNSAIVRGVDSLKGAQVMATDLRASVALVIAGLCATEGETTVNRIYHLERGYEDIAGKLSAVGADIKREL